MDYINIQNIFNPLYIHSRFFGCNLFHLPKSSKTKNVSIMASDIFLLLGHFGIYVWLFLTLNYSPSKYDQILRNVVFNLTESSGSLIMEFLGRIIFHMVGITNIYTMAMDLLNRNKIWKLLRHLHNFDTAMKKLGVSSNRYVSRNSIILYTIVIVAINASNISICYLVYKGLNIENIAIGFKFYAAAQLSDGCFVSMMGIFIFFLYNILQRFRKINKIVMQFYNIKGDSKHSAYPIGYDFRITEIPILHSHLSDVVRLVTETYSIQVMFAVLTTSSFSLISAYIIYKRVASFETIGLIGSLLYISRAVYYNFYFLLVISLSTAIAIESKRIGSLINKSINKSGNDASTNKKLEQFSYQVSHCSAEVTCGLFTFDWNIFYVIVGASLTYLTLFIQFDQQIQYQNSISIN